MKYDIILFDADGTLYDFDASESNALTQTLLWAGLPVREDILSLYHEINDREWKALERGETTRERLRTERFEKFMAETAPMGFTTEKTAVQIADHYIEALSHQCILMEDAVEVCEKLSRCCSLYIITNGTSWVQRSRFKDSPLNEYIKKTYISEDIGTAKPAKEYFDAVLADLGLSYEEAAKRAIVIGDSLTSDIKGGITAGLDTCWFSPENAVSGEIKPTYTVRSLTDIISICLSE